MLLRILEMQKTESYECVLLKLHFGVVLHASLNSQCNWHLHCSNPYIWRDIGKPVTFSTHAHTLLNCSAETTGFLSSTERLAFYVSIINKINPIHQWVGAERQNCSSNNRFSGQNNMIDFLWYEMKDTFIYVNVFSFEEYSNALNWGKTQYSQWLLRSGLYLKLEMWVGCLGLHNTKGL